MSAAEKLHHIQAIVDGGDPPGLALWKISRILDGAENRPDTRYYYDESHLVSEHVLQQLPSIDPDDNSWMRAGTTALTGGEDLPEPSERK